jgi:hypothetical protein
MCRRSAISNPPHDAEIEGHDHAGLVDQHVARVHVAVEKPSRKTWLKKTRAPAP